MAYVVKKLSAKLESIMQVYGMLIHQFANPLAFTIQNLLKSVISIVIIHIDGKTSIKDVKEIHEKLGKHQALYYVEDIDRVNVMFKS